MMEASSQLFPLPPVTPAYDKLEKNPNQHRDTIVCTLQGFCVAMQESIWHW